MEFTPKEGSGHDQDGFIRALKGKRKTILEAIGEAERGLTFKEVVSELGMKPATLAYHLKILVERDLLDKNFRSMDDRRDYSCYTITEKGKRATTLINEIQDRMSENINLPGLGSFPERIEIIQGSRRPRSIRIKMIKEGV